MILSRRGFISGIGSMLAAPAIVHAGNLMPVRALRHMSVVEAMANMQAEINTFMIDHLRNIIIYGTAVGRFQSHSSPTSLTSLTGSFQMRLRLQRRTA